MIIMRLSDGLGNQLFQFAAGEALRSRLNCHISYQVDSFFAKSARTDRPLLLPSLARCTGDVIPAQSLRGTVWNVARKLLMPRDQSLRHVPGFFYLTRSASCDTQFADILDGTFVSGYFQSWDCVHSVIDLVRDKITSSIDPLIKTAKKCVLPSRSMGQRFMALHLRLGDYQLIGKNNEALVPLERVERLISTISRDCVIVVFTDTPDIIKRIKLDRAFCVVNTGDDLLDFAAMMACDDFIIANSTYSWWASALGTSQSKKIFAPRDWSRPGMSGSDPSNKIYGPCHILY